MNHTNSGIYLNTASCGLLSKECLQSTYAFYEAMLTEASTAAEQLRDNGMQRMRETIASFMHAPADNIAFLPNFSYGLNALVQSLKGTEKLMLYRHDYPSLLEPFRINGFDITWIDAPDGFSIDIERMKNLLLQHKIDMLVISHVQWLSGYKLNIADIGSFCKEHNILFIVDATQSLGAVPIYIDKLHVDVLISSNYKWMNAGFGTGEMYMSDNFLQRYKPVIGGHNSYMMQDGEWKYVPSVRSYEPGHLNMHGLLVLEAAVNEKVKMDIEAIERHNTRLMQLLLDNIADTPILGPATMDNRSTIVMLKDESGKLHEHLQANGILAIRREGNIRVSFHYYNTEDEVRKLVDCLESYKAKVVLA